MLAASLIDLIESPEQAAIIPKAGAVSDTCRLVRMISAIRKYAYLYCQFRIQYSPHLYALTTDGPKQRYYHKAAYLFHLH